MVERAGLSVSAIRISELVGNGRVDPEYYQPRYKEMEERLVKISAVKVEAFATVTDGIHGSPDWVEEGGITYLSAKCVKDNRFVLTEAGLISQEQNSANPRTQARLNDVLVTSVGTIGNSAVVHKDILPANMDRHLGIIRIHKGVEVDPYYVATFLNSEYGRFQTLREATGNVQLNLFIEKIKMLLVPVGDQFSIVGNKTRVAYRKFDESEKLYAEAQALLAAELGLDRLDLSESLFSVRRASEVQTSSRADAEYYRRKYLNLLAYLNEKPHNTLAELATFSGGATPLGADYLDAGVPFLRIQNIGENRLVLDDVAYVDQEVHDGLLRRSQLAPSDVLITITGRIGTSAVVPDDLVEANINQHIVRMRLKSKSINPYYLAAFLNSVGGKLQTEREAYGTTRDALPYYCLAKIRVLKADAGLQNEIEQVVRKADDASHDVKRLLAEAKAEVERMIEEG